MLNKLVNMISRAVVSNPGKDDGEFPSTQATYNGKTAHVEVISPYGLAANLPAGSICLKFNINGMEENRAVIGYKHDIRPKNLKEGEVSVGNFMAGSTIFFDAEGNITEIASKNKNITFDAELNITGGTVKITADMEITGNILLTGDITQTGDTTITGNVDTTGILKNNTKVVGSTHTHNVTTAPGVTSEVN